MQNESLMYVIDDSTNIYTLDFLANDEQNYHDIS